VAGENKRTTCKTNAQKELLIFSWLAAFLLLIEVGRTGTGALFVGNFREKSNKNGVA